MTTEIRRPKSDEHASGDSLGADERMLRLLQASPEQRAAIDRILQGRLEVSRPAPIGPLLLMMGDAAKLLGVSRATVWRLVKMGRLEPVEILPGTFRVRREDVQALVARKQEGQ